MEIKVNRFNDTIIVDDAALDWKFEEIISKGWLFCQHKYCHGSFIYQNIVSYKMLYCSRCHIRIIFDSSNTSFAELKEYFDKLLNK